MEILVVVAGSVGRAVIEMAVAVNVHVEIVTIGLGVSAQRAVIDQDVTMSDLASQGPSVRQTIPRSVSPGGAQNDLGRIRFASA
jgi:hypothetical protein